MKQAIYAVLSFVMFLSCAQGPLKKGEENIALVNPISIPVAANSWVKDNVHQSSKLITKDGLTNWIDEQDIFRSFFYINQPGIYKLGLDVRMMDAPSKIRVTSGSIREEIEVVSDSLTYVYLGEIVVKEAGYQHVEFQGIEKKGQKFAAIENVLIGDNIQDIGVHFIKESVYFGRRGPSVHLKYVVPDKIKDIEWFYSELEIPKGSDVIGSFFMANGFKDGYFGIQVNSETERRILFSVWSPYKTDDPSEIPEDHRIQLLKKGEGVTTGKFGNEGSGGQSYKVFPWEAGKRYGFLLRGLPAPNNSTDYSAYFFDPVNSKWDLIASFRRPQGQSYLERLHSFLENFIPNTGVIERQGGYYNQWVIDRRGNKVSLNKAYFTADQTAKVKDRMDYSGGIVNDGFYLRNCGFSNEQLEINRLLSKPMALEPPVINFQLLK